MDRSTDKYQYYRRAYELQKKFPDSAIAILKKSIPAADSRIAADSWYLIGHIEKEREKLLEAVDAFGNAMLEYDDSKYEAGIVSSSMALGQCYYMDGHFDLSKSYYLEAFDLSPSELKNECMYNLALVYKQLQQFDSAIWHAYKAYNEFLIDSDASNTCRMLNEIGQIYFYAGIYDSALVYYSDMLDMSLQFDFDRYKAFGYQNLGVTHSKMGNYDTAINLLNRSLKFWTERRKQYVYFQLAEIYKAINETDSAYRYYVLSKNHYSNMIDREEYVRTMYSLMQIFEESNIDSALHYSNALSQIALDVTISKKQMSKYHQQFELRKAHEKLQERIRELNDRSRIIFFWLLTSGLLLVIVVLYWLYGHKLPARYKFKIKVLSKQNQELIRTLKDLMQSTSGNQKT